MTTLTIGRKPKGLFSAPAKAPDPAPVPESKPQAARPKKAAGKAKQPRVQVPPESDYIRQTILPKAEEYNLLWPGLFDKRDLRPLQCGILKILLADIEQRGLEIAPQELRSFVAGWKSMSKYQVACLTRKHRIGLNGLREPVSDRTRVDARATLEEKLKAYRRQLLWEKSQPPHAATPE